MGKSLPSTARLQDFARIIASSAGKLHRPKQIRPASKTRVAPAAAAEPARPRRVRVESEQQLRRWVVHRMEESSEEAEIRRRQEAEQNRLPLSAVVSDCVKRWFQDTLKEAKAGDVSMQLLVAQMYYNGYGVPRDEHKGRSWLTRASKSRSSVWQVCGKHPGYHASDSDSDDVKDEAN